MSEGKMPNWEKDTVSNEVGNKQNKTSSDIGSDQFIEKNKLNPTLLSLLEEIFKPTVSKDGVRKSAKPTKSVLKAINDLSDSDDLTISKSDDLIRNIDLTDSEFNAIAQIVSVAIRSKKHKLRKYLIQFFVKAVSLCWINNHSASFDLYSDVLEHRNKPYDDPLPFLYKWLMDVYEKRINFIKTKKKPEELSGEQVNHVNVEEQTAPLSYDLAALKAQRDNVFFIGALYLLDKGDVTPQTAINFFVTLDEVSKSRWINELEVAIFLAEQVNAANSEFSDALAYFKRQLYELNEKQSNLQRELAVRKTELEKMQSLFSTRNQQIDELNGKCSQYIAEINKLRLDFDQRELDERAKRVHLRDDTGRVRAKAINLLAEDVIEPLRLSLAALRRDNPKTEVAAHHIELVLESVERELKWFKE